MHSDHMLQCDKPSATPRSLLQDKEMAEAADESDSDDEDVIAVDVGIGCVHYSPKTAV